MRRKYCVIVITIILSLCFLCGCGEVPEEKIDCEPHIERIKSICNLATLECYYHNVAKSEKKAQKGLKHIGEVDRKFWIEYTGVAKIGLDVSKVTMVINGDNLTINIPEAQLLRINVEENSLNDNSYVLSDDSWNKNKITASDQTEAINTAQQTMTEKVQNDHALMKDAQMRAQKLIENYILRIEEYSGKQYNITWVYEDET